MFKVGEWEKWCNEALNDFSMGDASAKKVFALIQKSQHITHWKETEEHPTEESRALQLWNNHIDKKKKKGKTKQNKNKESR